MAILGTLEDLDLPGILQLLHTQSKMGTLILKSAQGQEAKVFFEKGDIVGSEGLAVSGKSRIGEMLVRAGLIDAGSVEEAMSRQKSGEERLGEILLQMKKIGREELAEILRLQIYETVYKLLAWKEGDFQFVAGPVKFDRELITPIETEHILMDSFRMVDEWPLIKRWIPSFQFVVVRTEAGRAVLGMPEPAPPGRMGTDTPESVAPWDEPLEQLLAELERGAGSEARTPGDRKGGTQRFAPTEIAQRPKLREPVRGETQADPTPGGTPLRSSDGAWSMDETETKVFGLVNDARTVQGLIDLSRMGEFAACQAIVNLLRRGLIRLAEPLEGVRKSKAASARVSRIHFPRWLGEGAGYAALALAVVSFVWFLASTILPLGPLGAEQEARGFPLWSFILHQKIVTVNNALRVYYFEKGRFPEKVEGLVEEGFLSAVDLRSLEGAVQYEGAARGRVHLMGEPVATGEGELETEVPTPKKAKVSPFATRQK